MISDYIKKHLICNFATQGLNSRGFGIFSIEMLLQMSDFHFQTQTGPGTGSVSRFPETGFRNVLPRKGTRTHMS